MPTGERGFLAGERGCVRSCKGRQPRGVAASTPGLTPSRRRAPPASAIEIRRTSSRTRRDDRRKRHADGGGGRTSSRGCRSPGWCREGRPDRRRRSRRGRGLASCGAGVNRLRANTNAAAVFVDWMSTRAALVPSSPKSGDGPRAGIGFLQLVYAERCTANSRTAQRARLEHVGRQRGPVVIADETGQRFDDVVARRRGAVVVGS